MVTPPQFFGGCFVILLGIFCLLIAVATARAQSAPLFHVKHDSFSCYYDTITHNPALVVYYLEYGHFSGSSKISGRHFKADIKLPRPRVKDGDYTNTGFVRGHLMSAADRDSNKGWLKESYLTSNLVPMTMVFNSGPWKVVEDSCRLLAAQGHRLLLVKLPMYYKLQWPHGLVIQSRSGASSRVLRIGIPSGFLCLAKCVDCGQRWHWYKEQLKLIPELYYETSQAQPKLERSTSSLLEHNTRFQESCITHSSLYYDTRVATLLLNILGTWSLEEYETITR